jgi:hypothetical protein
VFEVRVSHISLSQDGETPLDFAISRGKTETAALLQVIIFTCFDVIKKAIVCVKLTLVSVHSRAARRKAKCAEAEITRVLLFASQLHRLPPFFSFSRALFFCVSDIRGTDAVPCQP